MQIGSTKKQKIIKNYMFSLKNAVSECLLRFFVLLKAQKKSGRVVKNTFSTAYDNFSICTQDNALFKIFSRYESVLMPAF